MKYEQIAVTAKEWLLEAYKSTKTSEESFSTNPGNRLVILDPENEKSLQLPSVLKQQHPQLEQVMASNLTPKQMIWIDTS